ncbi:MAG: CPBP family intramembrane metalloprotease [Proteobacteria bacterium]|nr:CPBP family intramembrane metalloprotease [Pseudomonadota bacterium]
MLSAHEENVQLPRLGVRKGVALVAFSFAMAVLLGEAYASAATLIGPPWLAALAVNLLLAVVVATWRLKQGDTRLFLPVPTRWYAPAASVLLLCLLVAWTSRFVLKPSGAAGPSPDLGAVPWAWLVWVPIAEEVVFRAGIGQSLRLQAPRIWAGWFSAAIFALVHAHPTLAHVLAGEVGLVTGPFLLALCCEALVAWSGSILPAILLHAACNATVVVFQTVDERWLGWLDFLYS